MDKLKFRRSQREVDSKTDEKPSVETSSRKELRKAKRGEATEPKKTLWVQIRMIPIWLRLILIILLIAIVAVIGLRFGYSYIGDGNPEDVLKKETWTHIIDIIKGKE
ncbi:DNA-directed RNA polymerase subunit beta [Sporosarcina sp. Marseille-Q4063]|nr:DNA-directed RNA polymerase subunit beta [Sporosarcina sp. Marseille-Q4063]